MHTPCHFSATAIFLIKALSLSSLNLLKQLSSWTRESFPDPLCNSQGHIPNGRRPTPAGLDSKHCQGRLNVWFSTYTQCLAHNCCRKDERKDYQGERKDGGRKLKEKKEGKRVGGESRRGTLLNVVSSNFFVFSQVLGTFNFGPSLIQSMFPPQRAIPFSPFFTR